MILQLFAYFFLDASIHTYECVLGISSFLFAKNNIFYRAYLLCSMNLNVSRHTYSRYLLNTNVAIIRFYFSFMLKKRTN